MSQPNEPCQNCCEMADENARLREALERIDHYCENAQPCDDNGCLWQSHITTLAKQGLAALNAKERT